MRAAKVVAIAAVAVLAGPSQAARASDDEVAAALAQRPLDGRGNNTAHPTWGQAGQRYLRIAAANYADGVGTPVAGPPTRYVSNRIFADGAQNLFSENAVTQWGFAWGQFLDHTFGLRVEASGERAPIAFNANDPLEAFRNDFGAIDFMRTPAAPGTGANGVAREHVNTVSSFIDASAVYGDSPERLAWLREGPKLLLDPGGLLPRRTSRGDLASAPEMALPGRLVVAPASAMVAGDVRANENLALTATHTLFAREHNRIVDALPASVPDELKFQIARRVVSAEQQYITYAEFLPAVGIRLGSYKGYDPTVDPTLTNEFAVVGYRAHSMIHGEIEAEGVYSEAQLAAFEAMGIGVEREDEHAELAIPLNLAFANPDLLVSVGVEPVLEGLGAEAEYSNDEMIDNQLRSVLFQVPRPGVPNPLACLDGPPLPSCFSGVTDLGAIDVERGRDHGMPSYNDLRRAYGLSRKPSFTAITGEATDQFPAGLGVDDPRSLEFTSLLDLSGHEMPLDSDAGAAHGVRRSTLAARLRALYGDVDKLDAFTGMLAERHVLGAEFGELQLAAWRDQFRALRDGDRFFYLNDPALALIEREYGIGAKRTLAQVIEANTALDMRDDVFKLDGAPSYDPQDGGLGGTVAATMSLTLGSAPAFGVFSPGVARDYTASTTATVISTAGDATLSVADPSSLAAGHLVNGSHALPRALRVGSAPLGGAPSVVRTWSEPTSNEAVAVAFTQPIGAGDALRTGGYAKALTFTLSTSSP